MARSRPQRIATAAVAAAWCACGGTSSKSIDDLDDRLVAAVCQTRVACGLSPDVASCTAGAEVFVSPLVVDLVHAGRIHYDEQVGEACIASLGSAACDTTDPELRYALDRNSVPVPPAGSGEACDQMLDGTLAGGVECEASPECSTAQRLTWLADTRCQFKPNCAPPGCFGECIPQQPDPGGACHHDEECAPGLFCTPQTDTCAEPVCAGSACYSLSGCDYPSLCSNFLGGQGVCTVPELPGVVGQTCDPDSGCANLDDYCSVVSLTCVTFAAVGSACGSDVECVPYAECTAGTCAACSDADDCASS